MNLFFTGGSFWLLTVWYQASWYIYVLHFYSGSFVPDIDDVKQH